MLYESTRGMNTQVTSAQAIKQGIASDGGLFVPCDQVTLNLSEINNLTSMTYNERAIYILQKFLSDFSNQEIKTCVENAYTISKFQNPQIAPLIKLNNRAFILELWHGPTCAFKDMALQLLPHLLVKSIQKSDDNNEVVILVATSGDTGKAALEGFKGVLGTSVIVFYPKSGVSEVQRYQMITTEGNNVHCIGINGNFDDAQNGVKKIFANSSLNKKFLQTSHVLSSANSINWGRLAPQIVYYFSSYADMISKKYINSGELVNFVVPTGNFGNILAGYYAKKMGLPINKLICASNPNNVLTDFINTGVYDKNRKFEKTISPSMDILISSNLERLLYDITQKNSSLVNTWMDELNTKNSYTIDEKYKSIIKELFWADYVTDQETLASIKSTYNQYQYVSDTHTAVAINVYDKYVAATGDITKTVIVSTASPFKFNDSVASSILDKSIIDKKSEFELLGIISEQLNLKIPESLYNLESKPILHSKVCDIEDMELMVDSIINRV